MYKGSVRKKFVGVKAESERDSHLPSIKFSFDFIIEFHVHKSFISSDAVEVMSPQIVISKGIVATKEQELRPQLKKNKRLSQIFKNCHREGMGLTKNVCETCCGFIL